MWERKSWDVFIGLEGLAGVSKSVSDDDFLWGSFYLKYHRLFSNG